MVHYIPLSGQWGLSVTLPFLELWPGQLRFEVF